MFSLWLLEFYSGPVSSVHCLTGGACRCPVMEWSPLLGVSLVSVSVIIVAQKQMEVNVPQHLQEVEGWSESIR